MLNIKFNSISFYLLWFFIVSCTHKQQINRISSRLPELYKKRTDRGKLKSNNVKQIYKKVEIKKINPNDFTKETGSLYSLSDKRNDFYTSNNAIENLDFIDVKVVGNFSDEDKKNDKKNDKKTNKKDENIGELEKKLLAALPELKPLEDEKKKLLAELSFKIIHRYKNGDVKIEYNRNSSEGDKVNNINIKAIIPFINTKNLLPLSTKSLHNVKISQNTNGVLITRNSTNWENEYSLRASGFSEVKSIISSDLDNQRTALNKSKDQLKTAITDLSKQRNQVIKERTRIAKREEDLNKVINKLNKEVKDKEAVITDKNAQIESLKKASLKDDPKKETK